MTLPASTPASPRREAAPWLRIVGYFVVFFASMTLLGIVFTLGGVAIILIPGPVPVWLAVSYVVVSILGSVVISLLVANGVFRTAASPPAGAPTGTTRRSAPTFLRWIAGIAGTVIGGVLSAALGAIVLERMGR